MVSTLEQERMIFEALKRGAAPVCAWCPDFDRTDPSNAGKSSTMCPTCVQKMESQR